MTIGSQFLARLSETKKEVTKGYKFDAATESMKRQLRDVGGKNDFADKIAEVAAMSGIQGRFMNTPEGRESVLEGAQTLRAKPASVAAFLALHSALAKFHGYTPVVEAKSEEDDLEGVAFQQLVEEVLVALGLPQSLVSAGAKAGVKSSVKRQIAELQRDSNVKVAYQFLAKKLGIKVNDGVVGAKKPGDKKVVEAQEEAAPAQATDLLSAAKTIIAALGVDLADEKLVRIPNPASLDRAIKTALRNGSTKRAVSAFLRVMKTGQ